MKVDVICNVFGKPWQTLCTLKSLLKYSGKYIDKIYIIEECTQPYNENIKFILEEFSSIIHYIPKNYVFLNPTHADVSDKDNRYIFRYQYGIENSDKKYVFITHNDILYTKDIIGDMLKDVNSCVGIGLIGQCWNCPAKYASLCNGDIFPKYSPSYTEFRELCNIYQPARQGWFLAKIDETNPIPSPECRLNEFACLIDREVTNRECYPVGDSPLFGAVSLDIGDVWFKSLFLKGYSFKNFNISDYSTHGYFTPIQKEVNTSGYPTQLDINLYKESELNAKNYYKENFK